MKVVIPGGTGQVGTMLARAFVSRGDEVVVIGRHHRATPARYVQWDGASAGPWVRELDGADVVINLAGRSVNCRYTPANRREIIRSRVNSIDAIARGIAEVRRPPRVWLQAGTATIYEHRYDAPNDETTGILGGALPNVPDTWRFSLDVAQQWERAAAAVALSATRIVTMRMAMVMSPDVDGVFDTLLGLVRCGLGGASGNGRQFVSWIHEADFVRVVDWLIARDSLRGAINVCSPHPVPNTDFMRAMRDAWGIRWGLPAAEWMLEIGALFLSTETELILKSRRVVPGILSADGITFSYPMWDVAVRELLSRWRAAHSARRRF